MTETLGFNIADVLAMIAILIGLLVGFRQGLSGQMTILLTGLAIGFALVKGFTPCKNWLVTHMTLAPDTADMLARVILVGAPLLGGILLYLLLRFLFKITFTTWLDRLGGALAGGVTAAGIVLLVFILLSAVPSGKKPSFVGNSSWISREVLGQETQWVERIAARVEKGEKVIEKARKERTGKREKWEE